MIRNLIHDDLIFLRRKSEEATLDDLPIAQDLADTLAAHRETCVGMAANMIGHTKRIIAFYDGSTITVMLNPRITKRSGAYTTEEACLSLTGTRPTKRYHSIKVEYQTEKLQKRLKSYNGLTAQIIQHELDHCEGILI